MCVDGKFCGVNSDILQRMLELVRDNYRKADKATFFLETRTGKTNIQGITNLRDVLSHFATLLGTEMTIEQAHAQVASAEEHLRRAILEPYEIALNEKINKYMVLHEKYLAEVIPVLERHVALRNAPDQDVIKARMNEIYSLAEKGRIAKGKNLWNPDWEHGVAGYIQAYDALDKLDDEIQKAYVQWEQIAANQTSEKLGITGVQLGIAAIILALVTFVAGLFLGPIVDKKFFTSPSPTAATPTHADPASSK